MPNFVDVTYQQTGKSLDTDALGMREMQRRAFEERNAQYLLLKAPPASGKSRALMFLGLALFTFSKMGGEFVPQLDEGDIAFHTILKPGSSLTEAIESTTKGEKLLMDNFPEIEKVVSRIGVAEVPTDPMPMDIADCFIILKPIDQWTTTQSKEELIEMMKSTVEKLPGLNYEFTQPIEMRFNELLEGVREDIAIKLYGDDIDILASKAEEVSQIIAGTKGIGDMKVEATKGLPQMTINYNRQKLAQYGLSISELNSVVEASFAGKTAGVIFEGERRFDMVVRLQKENRKSIEDIQSIFIHTPDGAKVPLSELAKVVFEPGPMQISRDNTNRRIYVGINVRGRDIKSLVEEIQTKLDDKLVLPAGYFIRYGGAFENLERASNRLKMVVPVALALIFTLIFFALKSMKQSLMIFMAIPLAAIGGVFALWFRDMPFSISAGVGFIVLFGVAVLNGLVLISGWNELKEEGVDDIDERIRSGAKRRIRPILLTALTDILGFLPMAISSSAGAEVQRPLATVVIGGMLSATVLTLFIMPILYRWMENKEALKLKPNNGVLAVFIVGITLCITPSLSAQGMNQSINTLDEAVNIGLINNASLKSSNTKVELLEQEKKGAIEFDKMDLNVLYGQYNSFENDMSFQVSQKIPFPTVFSAQKKLATEKVEASELEVEIITNQLKANIKSVWYELMYLNEKQKLLQYQDSIYQRFYEGVQIRYRLEETSYMEKVVAEAKLMELRNDLHMLGNDIKIQEKLLRVILNNDSLVFKVPSLDRKVFESLSLNGNLENNPSIKLSKQQIEIEDARTTLEQSKMYPDFSIGYFNQTAIGNNTSSGGIATNSDRFSGVQIGLSIPLFYGSYKSNIKESKLETEIQTIESQYYINQTLGAYENQLQEVLKYKMSLEYYDLKAIPQADLLLNNAQKSFENGAIEYVEYFQGVNQGLALKINYLNTLNGYNQSLISLEYLLGL